MLNSREWHETAYARGIPSSFFPSFLRFLFIAKVPRRRPARGKRASGADGQEGERTMHNGRSSGRLKCNGAARRHRDAGLVCRAAARVKIKIARKNVRREQSAGAVDGRVD